MAVARAVVIEVLRKMSQTGSFTFRLEENIAHLVKEGNPVAIVLPEQVVRAMVAKLANKYCGGRTEYFYHPEMLQDGDPRTQ